MARIVGEVRPRYVWVENSPLLVSRGLDTVLADLATMGYDARWGIVGAHHTRAPHRRERVWVGAWDTNCVHVAAVGTIQGEIQSPNPGRVCPDMADSGDGESWWATEPELG